ncbi:MAG: 16S rRNA (uracil(1498)-N(3))-methyltransferase [Candidatus Omnitrophica bacterium]|nr:16S rRNA (uracil(1498)-N(3))-methyltransferase [Candidatus Omnitrophota bacterium]
MNLILLERRDFTAENHAVVDGRRCKHIREVLKARPGTVLLVGVENDLIGTGTVTAVTGATIELDVTLNREPPQPFPGTVVLALPRPGVFQRILVHATTLGVKKIRVINSNRVEKSYWQSPALDEGNVHKQLILGLEQARDTVLPEVCFHKGFKPFVEDELPALIQGAAAFVAHAEALTDCPAGIQGQVVLIIGPEGGFIPYEIEKFVACGCAPVRLGKRTLKVETAVTAFLARFL